ncbi:Qat anti-phage system associated protein QatB [Sinorhizobium medicae]|uniref:Qat anti-phage system associated protein QatB n=1 Tax=Sinorhizobium medicae TaxID=110321 RepID=UPI002B1BE450|nr:Qat anti-phage system associated protein QatB [Sinorhizobium medicae]WQO45913.1 Qat anti-phage system associated protein QatB [Sinorhizobium medicae]
MAPDGVAGNGKVDGDAESDNDGPLPPIHAAPAPNRFQSARTNFSTFASSRGGDRPALQRAVRDYVRSGTRGSGNAVRRMGSSRAAASNVLGVLRGMQRDGVQAALRSFNLTALIGRSTTEVFLGLTDLICRDGGPIDEAIARDAWLETVAELDRFNIGDLDALTADQIRDVFAAFIAHSVETMLFQEIGVNGLAIARDLDAIELFEAQFRSYIQRAVQDSFATDLRDLSTMSDRDIHTVVDATYKDAWELLVAWGDRAP